MSTGRVQILAVRPPGANFATPVVIVGASTPAEHIPAWAFDGTTVEYLDFVCRLDGYGGGGLTLTLPWAAQSATSGAVVWGAAIRRIQDDAEDLDSTAHTYDFNDASADTAPSALKEVSYPTITFTDGVDMDSWASGELAVVRVRRNPADAGDNMTGDAYLIAMVGVET